MFTLETMPAHARVWIYQTNRELSTTEVAAITQAGQEFVAGWAAHGTPLTAATTVVDNYFLVIAVDEQQAAATGCSIDKSVNFVKGLAQHLNIDFFNRLNIATVVDGKIALLPLAKFEDMAKTGELTPDSVIYDNTIATVADYQSRWKTPVSNTWMNRYFALHPAK